MKKTTQWLIEKCNTRMIILSIIVLIILSILSLIGIGRYKVRKEEQEARKFLGQMIKSVDNQTNFYKNHAHVIDIKDIEIHRNKFSDNYKIELIEYDPGHYVYSFIFDNKYRFSAIVIRGEKDFWLSHFKAENQ